MAEGDGQPTVLVVEDERALVELYVRWLEDDYDVRTADCGEAALEELDEDVDVVLLDRRMPGMSGDEVLSKLRQRVPDCKVAMVTAVEPDFDVITMGFDDYLTKPVGQEELLDTVERLRSRSAFAELERKLYALVAKRAALQASKADEELAEHEEFAELERRIADLQRELDDALPHMESDEFVALVRDIESDEFVALVRDIEGDDAGSADDGGSDDADDDAGGSDSTDGDDADEPSTDTGGCSG